MAKVKFLPPETIEEEACGVLAKYARIRQQPISVPVPIEDILDCLFDVSIEAADLQTKFHSTDVLAEFLVGKKRKVILIDQSIHPEFHKEQENRYRFTLGHETGHWILHQHLLEGVHAEDLFDDAPKTVSVYRSSCKEPKEKQADMFAGDILMPRELILQEWVRKFGPDHGPENVYEEICEKSERFQAEARDIRCDLAREFAKTFSVSAQSMQIRLIEMNLLQVSEPEPSLF